MSSNTLLVWFFSNFPYNSSHTFCLFCHNIHGVCVCVWPVYVCVCAAFVSVHVRVCVHACVRARVWCMHASMHEWMCVLVKCSCFDLKEFQCMCATLKVALTVSAQNHQLTTLPTLSTCSCTKLGTQRHSLVLFLSFIFFFSFSFSLVSQGQNQALSSMPLILALLELRS